MNIKKISLLTAAVMLSMLAVGCGDKEQGEDKPSDNYVAVYQEFTEAPIADESAADTSSLVSEPPVTEILQETEPVTAVMQPADDDCLQYLDSAFFLGDGICNGLVSCGMLTYDDVAAIPGAKPYNILDFKVNGVLVSDLLQAADRPYIYVWFSEDSIFDDYSAEEYGWEILDLCKEIRELCPDSMVLPISSTPMSSSKGYADEMEEYNEELYIAIKSCPDEYVIYTHTFPALSENGYLSEIYGDSDGLSADGFKALLYYICRDRYYNDMTEYDYSHITAKRPAYSVTDGKVAYLTFDDGPSKYTPEILDTLDENGIKATFFITGWCIDGKEDILRDIADRGHLIALHSFSHDYEEIYESTEAWMDDFAKVYGRVYAVTGQKPWAFRFPGGSYNNYNRDTADDIISEMNSRGFTYFDWNAATSDASSDATYDSCVEYLRESINADHEVVLMHDSLELTPQYLQEVIDHLLSEGYSFETAVTADVIHF